MQSILAFGIKSGGISMVLAGFAAVDIWLLAARKLPLRTVSADVSIQVVGGNASRAKAAERSAATTKVASKSAMQGQVGARRAHIRVVLRRGPKVVAVGASAASQQLDMVN